MCWRRRLQDDLRVWGNKPQCKKTASLPWWSRWWSQSCWWKCCKWHLQEDLWKVEWKLTQKQSCYRNVFFVWFHTQNVPRLTQRWRRGTTISCQNAACLQLLCKANDALPFILTTITSLPHGSLEYIYIYIWDFMHVCGNTWSVDVISGSGSWHLPLYLSTSEC